MKVKLYNNMYSPYVLNKDIINNSEKEIMIQPGESFEVEKELLDNLIKNRKSFKYLFESEKLRMLNIRDKERLPEGLPTTEMDSTKKNFKSKLDVNDDLNIDGRHNVESASLSDIKKKSKNFSNN